MDKAVYIAHPIDSVNENLYQQILGECFIARRLLNRRGVGTYLPGRAWSLPAGWSGTAPAETNKTALMSADALLVMANISDKTLGVGYEMGLFEKTGRPIVAVVKEQRLAFGSNVVQFLTVAAAVEYLEKRLSNQLGHASEAVASYTGTGDAPARAHSDDAGFDLRYSGTEPMKIPAGASADVPSGVAVELPEGMWCLLIGRSSSFRNRGLLVNVAVIDPGYRGELFAIVRNISDSDVHLQPGERIAQIVPMLNIAGQISRFDLADRLSDTHRGDKGFGSSGL